MDKKQLECLNQMEEHGVENLFSPGDSYCQSDCDEQVLDTNMYKNVHVYI